MQPPFRALVRLGQMVSLVAVAIGALRCAPASSPLLSDFPADADGGAAVEEPTPSDGGSTDATPSPMGAFGTPTDLVAFVGGDTIALRWSSPAAPEQVKGYDVYRDGTKVGSVTPGFHPEFPEKLGNGFLDRSISAGTTYMYSVQAVDPHGMLSQMSASLEVVAPPSLLPPPSIMVDLSNAPDLEAWTTNFAKPLLEVWYPKIAYALTLPEVSPRWTFSLVFNPELAEGIWSNSRADRIEVNPLLVRKNLEGLGPLLAAVTMTMFTQSTGGMPAWMRSGLGSWVREAMVHERDRWAPTPGFLYTDGHGWASPFLSWIQDTYEQPTLRSVAIASVKQTYSDDLLVENTSKSLPQLWEAFTGQTVRGPAPLAFRGLENKCVDSAGGIATVQTCNGGTGAQAWKTILSKDETLVLRAPSGCLDVRQSGTANGTSILVYTCNGTGAQRWRQQADGTLVNPQSGRCLDDPGASTTDGTPLQLYDCRTSSSQQVTLP